MILTVNIGNTHITVGGYEQETLIFCGRLHSDPAATVEEYAIRLVNLLQLYGASPAQIEGGILGSGIPAGMGFRDRHYYLLAVRKRKGCKEGASGRAGNDDYRWRR